MPLREFLRGGYQGIDEPTIVTSRGRPVFQVIPAARDFRTTERRATVPPGPPGPSPNGG